MAQCQRHCVRVVKEMDSKSIGLCPQGFESPWCRFSLGMVVAPHHHQVWGPAQLCAYPSMADACIGSPLPDIANCDGPGPATSKADGQQASSSLWGQWMRARALNHWAHHPLHTAKHVHVAGLEACRRHLSHSPGARQDVTRPCGLMDKALVLGTKDCRFESCQGHFSGASIRHSRILSAASSRPGDKSSHVHSANINRCSRQGQAEQGPNSGLHAFLWSLSCQNTHCGARTHDHKVKSLALCRLS